MCMHMYLLDVAKQQSCTSVIFKLCIYMTYGKTQIAIYVYTPLKIIADPMQLCNYIYMHYNCTATHTM